MYSNSLQINCWALDHLPWASAQTASNKKPKQGPINLAGGQGTALAPPSIPVDHAALCCVGYRRL